MAELATGQIKRLAFLGSLAPAELLRELLAAMNRDGGQHADRVGLARAVLDAETAWYDIVTDAKHIPLPPTLEWMVAIALKHLIEDWIVPDENTAAWKAWVARMVDDIDKMEDSSEETLLKSINDVLAFLDANRAQPDTGEKS